MSSLGAIDRQLSQPILTLDNPIISAILFPFSSMFHPKMIWIPILIVYYLSKKSLFDVALYCAGMLVCLIMTTLLKRKINRPRPDLNEKVNKSKKFRSKEKNCALPSGDTVQSMFFSMVLVMWFGADVGVMAVFHFLVAVSRIYFMCHWIGDTIAATIFTIPVGVIFTLARTDSRLQAKFYDILHSIIGK